MLSLLIPLFRSKQIIDTASAKSTWRQAKTMQLMQVSDHVANQVK